MAKAKTLAALAGLAGLAYAMRNKGDSSKTDTGDETDRLKGRGTPEEPRTDARSSGDEMSDIRRDVSSGDEMSKYASNYKPPKSVTPKAPPKSAAAKQTPSGRREDEAGTSRGTRGADASKAYPSGVMGGARQADTAKNTDYSNEGRSSTAPTIASKVGNIAKDTAIAAVKAANPVATAAYEFGTTPTSEQASANRQAAYDKVKSVGSKVADYVKNFETPAERRSREAKEASGMKRGGMTKMASGGMTASRRGDGIAQRGKTRGKMC
jgi:hypothetical protein